MPLTETANAVLNAMRRKPYLTEKHVALGIEQKQQIVAEVNEVAASALSAVLADYRGLTVAEMTEMRVKARESGVYLRVVRNTLAKRAVEGTEYECLNDAFIGPTLLAFSQEDPGAAARLLKDYAKDLEDLEIKALSIGGEMLGADQLDRVAKLPTLDEARSLLMSVMQAPVVKLARTLNEVPGKLTRTVAAIRDQKQAEG
jgi:large subunit ribosomal protein L10|tara:strand:- start:401 stop:1003 length:603 start_codon:yes stop_codon:yes gene_type:complete